MSRFTEMDLGPFTSELVELYQNTSQRMVTREGYLQQSRDELQGLKWGETETSALKKIWWRASLDQRLVEVFEERVKKQTWDLKQIQRKFGFLEKIYHLDAQYDHDHVYPRGLKAWEAQITTKDSAEMPAEVIYLGMDYLPHYDHFDYNGHQPYDEEFTARIDNNEPLLYQASAAIGFNYGWIVNYVLGAKERELEKQRKDDKRAQTRQQMDDLTFRRVNTPNL